MGGLDIFVVALDADGSDLWATMFGSSDSDFATAVALDPVGGVVVAGSTNSSFAGQWATWVQRSQGRPGSADWTRSSCASRSERVSSSHSVSAAPGTRR